MPPFGNADESIDAEVDDSHLLGDEDAEVDDSEVQYEDQAVDKGDEEPDFGGEAVPADGGSPEKGESS
jgi:hypothetical protein